MNIPEDKETNGRHVNEKHQSYSKFVFYNFPARLYLPCLKQSCTEPC